MVCDESLNSECENITERVLNKIQIHFHVKSIYIIRWIKCQKKNNNKKNITKRFQEKLI